MSIIQTRFYVLSSERIKTNQLINGKGVSVEPTLETEQKKIKIDHLINGKGIVYE